MPEKKLVFATNNLHKLEEVRQMLGPEFTLFSMKEIGCKEDIPETGSTFRENASIKARYIHERYGLDCFADDSGLEVDALGGAPGVFSARYAGSHGNAAANIDKLLRELKDKDVRSARFRAVIALIVGGNEHFFEGTVNGSIRPGRSGEGGFGYDPVFQPEGYDITFAEMKPEEKNRISHRGRAIEQLIAFLT
ncbi:XTP/dITP diphosphohydrolase [Anseongella ginsenosidimutans]|uniref:dITP/XTP pyrophosphatase n=1 Tax=Anseongella ginsenosidimutans TaxID=496056 RepID=A0A4R3KZY0_9SPHI|nr:non-canonical purine NTP diphosphatase [Anseongella ginsenosidimutans]QEC51140.1 non-canonical purine NTP diphosphatase [Anseongella ginsenosidimutans]TCS90190.1 XTP/dITP diphosphohydrolase [Anseongella ginsenosidimutans]